MRESRRRDDDDDDGRADDDGDDDDAALSYDAALSLVVFGDAAVLLGRSSEPGAVAKEIEAVASKRVVSRLPHLVARGFDELGRARRRRAERAGVRVAERQQARRAAAACRVADHRAHRSLELQRGRFRQAR